MRGKSEASFGDETDTKIGTIAWRKELSIQIFWDRLWTIPVTGSIFTLRPSGNQRPMPPASESTGDDGAQASP
jgi:hypothetical protein